MPSPHFSAGAKPITASEAKPPAKVGGFLLLGHISVDFSTSRLLNIDIDFHRL